MIRGAAYWLVTQLRELALGALGIREEIRLVRHVGTELEEWRAARDADTVDDLCPPFEAVDVEATTQIVCPSLVQADVECVEIGVAPRVSALRCTHEGIGLPMCIICDPRTHAEGGPQPDPIALALPVFSEPDDKPTKRVVWGWP